MVSESNRCSGCCESFIRFSSSIWFCAASGREPCSFKDMIDARHRESSARECQEHDIIYDRILAATSSLQRMAGSSGVVHPCGRHRNLRLLDCISLGNFPVWKLGGVGLLHEKSPTNKDLKWLKGVVASGPSWRTSLVGNSLSWFYFGLEFGQMRGHIAGLVMIWGLVSVLDRI